MVAREYEYEDLYTAIINNEYDIRPCGKCDNGKIYVDGKIGFEISSREYHKLLEDDDYKDYLEIEGCWDCFATGKIIKIHGDDDWC